MATGAAKVTCPNVLNSRTKICIIDLVALLVMLEAGLSVLDMKEHLLYSPDVCRYLGQSLLAVNYKAPKISSVVQS